MSKVKVGQRVQRVPKTFRNTGDPDAVGVTPTGKKARGSGASFKLVTGTVVWVHPKGRFHVVEFPMKRGAIREAFQGVEV